MANLLNERLDDSPEPVKKQKKQKKKKVELKKEKKHDTESVKITPKKKQDIIEEQKQVQQSYDEELDIISEKDFIKEERIAKRRKRKYYFAKIFMCFCCAYMLFLIYGVLVTNYDYDEDGNVTAQIMYIDDIQAQKEFSNLLGYYKQSRDLYEEVLLLDYRLGTGDEDLLSLAAEYKVLLDEASPIIVQLEAMNVSKNYSQAYTLLLNWTKTDICVYLQNISDAISQNDSEKASEAILDKETVYTDFYQTTANMISLGENIKGIDITDVKQWSPEEYIQDEIGK